MPSRAEQTRPSIRRFVAILVAVYASLTLGAHLAGPELITPLLPLYRQGLEWTHPEFVVRSLSVQDGTLRLEAQIKKVTPGRSGHRQVGSTFELPARQLLVAPIIALALLVAWPHRSRRLALTAFVLALPLVAVVELLDTPYAIAAIAAEQLSEPGKAPRDWEAFWWFFLDNGGRQFLSLWAAGCAVFAAQGLARKPSAPESPASKREERRSRRARRERKRARQTVATIEGTEHVEVMRATHEVAVRGRSSGRY